MAGRRTARRVAGHTGMSPFKAGIVALALLAVLSYFGFTKANPFADPYELNAVFQTANNLKPKSPVRIAGVDVGKVKSVEPVDSATGGARVTMEIEEKGLPIHEDAQLKVRPRIFLEGNFFVDVQPGSPSAPEVEDGGTIPMNQTAAPVQFGDLLTALQTDTREDLQTFLHEYAVKGLAGGGAQGFNDSIPYWEGAYRNSSLANDATLGQQPTKDLQRMLKGQARTFRALVRDERALKDLVTNFNITAGAFAREDVALEASIPELRDTLRRAQPALASLNSALPSVRAFARDALPGVRSSPETLDASMPFIRQARRLMSRAELRGLAAELRRQIPRLVALNESSVPVLRQSRQLSACTNNVLVPFVQSTYPNVEGPDAAHGNAEQQVRFQLQRGLVGLSGESRLSDGNNQWFHTAAGAPATRVQPAPPTVVDQPPPRRPDVPCETQEKPDLAAPSASVGAFLSTRELTDLLPILRGPIEVGPLRIAAREYRKYDAKRARRWERAQKKSASRKSAARRSKRSGARR
jgi:phospholipid/cholesterol/gamma-HCH transport system substrate-binding protein